MPTSTISMDVSITWRPRTAATLVLWIDDDEVIKPSARRLFTGSGKIEFTYPSADLDDYHEFEWTLLFPDKTLRGFEVEVSWDGGTWHTVGAHKKDIKHKWTSFGVAP